MFVVWLVFLGYLALGQWPLRCFKFLQNSYKVIYMMEFIEFNNSSVYWWSKTTKLCWLKLSVLSCGLQSSIKIHKWASRPSILPNCSSNSGLPWPLLITRSHSVYSSKSHSDMTSSTPALNTYPRNILVSSSAEILIVLMRSLYVSSNHRMSVFRLTSLTIHIGAFLAGIKKYEFNSKLKTNVFVTSR